jgi:hypothetical protein
MTSSISIKARQTIRPTGTPVSQTTWSPSEGYSRQQEIERARELALQEHQKNVENATTVGQRLQNLENLVVKLQGDLTKVYQLLGASTTEDARHS